jgi:hypothetical protein
MSADLFERNHIISLERATVEYEDAKKNFKEMIRRAFAEEDLNLRMKMYVDIEKEAKRLTDVVQNIQTSWDEGNIKDKEFSDQKILDLETELKNYRELLKTLKNKEDDVYQLKTVLDTITYETDESRYYYYGYIIVILVLLSSIFGMFIYSYLSMYLLAAIVLLIMVMVIFNKYFKLPTIFIKPST